MAELIELLADCEVIAYLTPEGDVVPPLSGSAEYVAAAGLVVAIVGLAIGAYGIYSSEQAKAEAASYNKKVARNQAQASRDAARVAGEIRQREIQRILGSQQARLGASGVIPSEGSPLIVQMESASQGELDLARIRYQGETQGRGYESAAILQGFYSKQARTAGQVGAGSSLLTGVGQAGSSYAYSQRRSTYNSGYDQAL